MANTTAEEANDRILIINASSIFTCDVNLASGDYDLPSRAANRGNVRDVFKYLDEFLCRPVDLAGLQMNDNITSLASIEPLTTLLQKDLHHKRVLIIVDETDIGGMPFTKVARYLDTVLGDEAKKNERSIVVIPATQTIKAAENADTTFTFGAAYQLLDQGTLGHGIYVGSRATFGPASTGYYVRHDQTIRTGRKSIIEVRETGGTIDGFAGRLLRPAGKESRVHQFFSEIVNSSQIRYNSNPITFADGRNLLVGAVDDLEKDLSQITPDSEIPKYALVTGGTFALGDLAREIRGVKVPTAFVGAWVPLNAFPFSDAGFNAGQAVAFLVYGKHDSNKPPSVVALNGQVLNAEWVEKDGAQSKMYDRRVGLHETTTPPNRPEVIVDPYNTPMLPS